ncbi:MAG TPA: OB-fold nucleic acid binding domain-containing protein, partial [Dehalococcoidales bacterium]|nr:OB-fold nucleic acid binding domain-containing protein [Dehalococcoidales bacterium]
LNSINRRVMESLIKAGAFDSLGNRGTLLNAVGDIMSLAQREQRARDSGQSTMFNLFGAEVPVPLTSLQMAEVDVPSKEKLAWEKELMGVYLSEHPFTPFAGKVAADNIMLCGQVDAEMNGQTVMVAGMVASVAHLITKQGKPFVKATLEDLEGSIEVMVWSDVYTETVDLWEDGTIVLLEGRVSARDDQMQISCKKASRYQPGQVVQPKKQQINGGEVKPSVVANGKAAYNGKSNGSNGKTATETVVSTPAPVVPAQRYRLTISINGTADEEADMNRLHRVIYAIKEYQGRDVVTLRIVNNGKTVNLKLPNIYTGYCSELQEKLVDLVGSDLKVEPIIEADAKENKPERLVA